MMSPFRFSRCLVLFVLPILGAPVVALAQNPGDVASPFELSSMKPGEARWLPVYRLRNAEATYRGSEKWWDTYAQMRSDFEHRVGNHAAALRFDDLRASPSTKTLELAPGVHAVDAVRALVSVADTARVIMINERHHAASDRLLTLRLLPLLWNKGYRYFAAEAFSYLDSGLTRRGYAEDAKTGYYTDDPVFGQTIREALRLGYKLIPYESRREQEDTADGHTAQQRRDSIQARNLFESIFRRDPKAKVLVHAGYSHILEEISPTWSPMALYFRAMTGIDPVTVDQTRLSERSAPEYEHPAYRAAIAAGLLREEPIILLDSAGHSYTPASFHVDFQVVNPRTTYTGGRPAWMRLDGARVAVDVPVQECAKRICVVEARMASESDSSVALDRTEVVQSTTARLFLPRGARARVQIRDSSGLVTRTLTVTGPGSPSSRRGRD